jgi:hypothetical protein
VALATFHDTLILTYPLIILYECKQENFAEESTEKYNRLFLPELEVGEDQFIFFQKSCQFFF